MSGGGGVGTPVDVSPIFWTRHDRFELTITLTVQLGQPGLNWWATEIEARDSIRRRFREARESLHQGRPR